MKTNLLDSTVKITEPIISDRLRWKGHLGKIVTVFNDDQPRYTILLVERDGTGKLADFYSQEFVVIVSPTLRDLLGKKTNE